MIFQHLRSIRSTQSAESRQSKGVNLPPSDQIEWDGVGGFDVSLQAPSLEHTSTDESGSGRFRKIMNICRVGSANRSSLRERKRSRPNDDETEMISGKQSTFCESDDINDNVRRKVARYVLTSMLSEEDETMGPYPRDKDDCTCNDKNTSDAQFSSISYKSAKECNDYENSFRRLHSYEDTVFDGIIEGTLPQESCTKGEKIIEAADRSEVVGTTGVVDATKVKFWPSMELNMCFQNVSIGMFQQTPENHTVTWKDKVVLSPLSY